MATKKKTAREDFDKEVNEVMLHVDKLGAPEKMKKTEYISYLKDLISRLEDARDCAMGEDKEDKRMGAGEYKGA